MAVCDLSLCIRGACLQTMPELNEKEARKKATHAWTAQKKKD